MSQQNNHYLIKEKIDAVFGHVLEILPEAILFYDSTDGSILRYNRRAEAAVMSTTGLPGMPKTVFGDMDKLSFVADRMRSHDEFEFYVFYDHAQERFVPLTRISGADFSKVLFAHNFCAKDPSGTFMCNALVIRPLIEIKNGVQISDLENAKYAMLTQAFGMCELNFNPYDMTLDVLGGRDEYNLKKVPIEQIAKVIHPDDAGFFVDQFADAAVQKPDSMMFTVRLYSIKLKSYRYFKMMFYPQIDSLGNVLSFGGFTIDVNEEEIAIHKKLAEVNKLVANAYEANKDDRNIISALANISHDLRNPIGIIMGISDMMAMTDDPVKRIKYNNTIQESAQRLLRMVDEILNLNRVEFGNVEVTKQTVDLESMLSNYTDIYLLQMHSHGLDIEYQGVGAPTVIETDKTRVAEILDNYMSNAIKYTTEGKVTVKYEDLGDDVCIHVIDTGQGISPEDCTKVFNRFEKLGAKKGNGIGLHICAGLAKALGGSVGVESEPGKGSDFWVRLPKKMQ